MNATFDDFQKIKIACGTIIEVDSGPFPRLKKPAYRVTVDFGKEIGILKTSAQITVHYKAENLIGKRVLGCVNIGERNIAGFISQFLLLGFSDANGDIILASPDVNFQNGITNGAILC